MTRSIQMNRTRRDVAFAHSRMEKRWGQFGFAGRFYASRSFTVDGKLSQKRNVRFVTPVDFRLEYVCLHPMLHASWTVASHDCLPDEYMGWNAYKLIQPVHFTKGRDVELVILVHRARSDARIAHLGLYGTGVDRPKVDIDTEGTDVSQT